MSEPETITRTEVSSHDYKGMLPIPTTTKGFQLSQDFN
jgi:hypothetical protein